MLNNLKNNMYNFLSWLDGKKAGINSMANAFIIYSLATGYIDNNMAILLASLVATATGTAIVATNKILGSKYRSKA